MQLLVVELFLVLLLSLYLAFTINFLPWLFNLQVLKDLNPNSAGCLLVSKWEAQLEVMSHCKGVSKILF